MSLLPLHLNAHDLEATRGSSHDVSFNGWGGFHSLDNFDNFYGSDNFDSSVHFSQTIVNEQEVVCHSQQIEIIQQRLVVIQELAKRSVILAVPATPPSLDTHAADSRIISEQICEVETQTVVFQQFHASLGLFQGDLRHFSG